MVLPIEQKDIDFRSRAVPDTLINFAELDARSSTPLDRNDCLTLLPHPQRQKRPGRSSTSEIAADISFPRGAGLAPFGEALVGSTLARHARRTFR